MRVDQIKTILILVLPPLVESADSYPSQYLELDATELSNQPTPDYPAWWPSST
jgi:hypothetical protein